MFYVAEEYLMTAERTWLHISKIGSLHSGHFTPRLYLSVFRLFLTVLKE